MLIYGLPLVLYIRLKIGEGALGRAAVVGKAVVGEMKDVAFFREKPRKIGQEYFWYQEFCLTS